MSDFVSVSGTSAVVIAKTNYLSMRASFSTSPKKVLYPHVLTFPNGTQKEVNHFLVFEVFLPETEPNFPCYLH